MKLVIALGGNAILPEGQEPYILPQFKTANKSLRRILPLILESEGTVITHGNGPQVGITFIRNWTMRRKIPMYPLDILDAETQGWMGYMLVHLLREILLEKKIKRDITSLVTQVLVDKRDPEFKNPSKPIGPFFTEEEAQEMRTLFPYPIKKDSNRGYRITVPSPRPLEILEKNIIKDRVDNRYILIAGGGGGIPLVRKGNKLKAVYGVVDKDLISSKIALDVEAEKMVIITSVPCVSLNFGTPHQKSIKKITLKEIKEYRGEGHFPPGSMGPKIDSAIDFLEGGGKEVLITSIEQVQNLEIGTRIVL